MAFAEKKFYAAIEPGIPLSPPICKGFERESKHAGFKLCLPSSVLRGDKIRISGNSLRINAPGEIKGPVLIETKPRLLLIGSMIIEKGGLDLSLTKSGSFQIKGTDGAFQLHGLVVPLSSTKPLIVDEVELEFTSPEDAILQLSASGQTVGVVLRVQKKDKFHYVFTPSPPLNSIFPDNQFFSDFHGQLSVKDSVMTLIMKDGMRVVLQSVS